MSRTQSRLFAGALAGLLVAPLPATSQDRIISREMARPLEGLLIQFEGASQPDATWWSSNGGALVITRPTSTTATRSTSTETALSVGDVTLTGPMTADRLAMTDWLNGAIEGRDPSRIVERTELLLDPRTGEVVEGRRVSYTRALPVRYVFPELSVTGSDPLVESLVFRPERAEGALGTRGAIGGATEPLMNGKFRIEIDGISNRVTTVSIDDLVFAVASGSTDADGWRTLTTRAAPRPGDLTISFVPGRPEVADWWQRASQGADERKNISISLMDSAAQEVRGYHFFDCVINSYDPGEYDVRTKDTITETATVSCARVEFL